MPRLQESPTQARKPRAQRSERSASKKTLDVAALAAAPEFDAAVHHKEIAEIAYCKWLERAEGPGSPEEDWLKAEIEARAKYEGGGA